MTSLQNTIVRKTIIGVLTCAGLGACSTAVWAVKTIIKHEQQFKSYEYKMRTLAQGIYAVGRRVGVADYELEPLRQMLQGNQE